ncbi:T9SS type A sorting domain-containing protein [bacterium]|nr:T9SS type A sorting domain-containing protein [bacterium]
MRVLFGVLVLATVAAAQQDAASPAFPLKISSDGRHLVDQNDTPFLINGDTPWSLMVKLTKQEVEEYLKNRRAKGFNAIITNLIEHYFGGPPNVYGEAPFTTPGDFATPNENYFIHADWVINKAAELDMLVVLTPAYLGFLCGEQGWCQEMITSGPEKCREYGRFLGRRYESFANIVWMHGGDAEPGQATEELGAIVEGIAETDTVHLRTAHCNRQRSALDCYDNEWLDINTTYSDCGQTPARTLADYGRKRILPFFYVEGTYENEGASAKCLRSQAYWSILGGSIGHFFGNNPIWLFGEGWQQVLESEGARSMTHLGALFRSRAWHDLVPDYDHEVVIAGYGDVSTSSYLAAARTRDGSTAMAYLPEARQITVDMSKISGAKVKGWWFDPTSGHASAIGELPASENMEFTPLSAGDWVLVLDNAELNLPAPGSMDVPVPVEFSGLSARAGETGVTLSWQTISETNNYGFEVQRSRDKQNFNKIGFVKGQGTTTQACSYSFIDRSVRRGKHAYRLKQIDTDGRHSFSQTVEISLDGPTGFELMQNHPNPFNHQTIIFYTLAESGFVSMKIYDIHGKEVANLVQTIQNAGNYSTNFVAKGMASGLYFCKIRINGFDAVKKMVLIQGQ